MTVNFELYINDTPGLLPRIDYNIITNTCPIHSDPHYTLLLSKILRYQVKYLEPN